MVSLYLVTNSPICYSQQVSILLCQPVREAPFFLGTHLGRPKRSIFAQHVGSQPSGSRAPNRIQATNGTFKFAVFHKHLQRVFLILSVYI